MARIPMKTTSVLGLPNPIPDKAAGTITTNADTSPLFLKRGGRGRSHWFAPERNSTEGTCLPGPLSEGRAGHVHFATLDHPLGFGGHGKCLPARSMDAVEGIPPTDADAALSDRPVGVRIVRSAQMFGSICGPILSGPRDR